MVSKWERKKEEFIPNLGKGNRGEDKGRESVEKGDVGGRGVEKEVGMSIDPDTYSPNIFVVERNTMFQQDLTKEGLWMLSLKGSLFFCFSGGERPKRRGAW